MTKAQSKSQGSKNTTTAVAASGYDASRYNALQHGVLSRLTILPWEDADDYATLLNALIAEHNPVGPTEHHLVEELAGAIWRKRRLRQAETATHRRALAETTGSFSRTATAALVLEEGNYDEISVSNAITVETGTEPGELALLDSELQMVRAAIKLLKTRTANAYAKALEEMPEDWREAWDDQLAWEQDDYDEDQEPFEPDTKSLLRFIETIVLESFEGRRMEIQARPLVRAQALGESFDPDRLERLGRYEVHLDRKFERILSTLIRLQDLREKKSNGIVD